MACRFEITVPGGDGAAVEAASAALDEIEQVERRLSVFRRDSEISRLNRTAHGGPVRAGRDVVSLLELCARVHQDTGGAFDPTIGPLTRCWGFLRRAGAIPSGDALAAARSAVGFSHVQVDAGAGCVAFARPGLELNLGSIGKGYALDAVAPELRRRSVNTALLSAGGSSVLALGPSDWSWWPVGLRDACDRTRRWAVLRLRDCALATSGAGEQFFESGGRRYGHILDPRSGHPVEGRRAVTVVASRAAVADALATAFFVGGPTLAESYCATHPDVLALVHQEASAVPVVVGSHRRCRVEVQDG
jgi:thiamine biosynthesis lipoprotein